MAINRATKTEYLKRLDQVIQARVLGGSRSQVIELLMTQCEISYDQAKRYYKEAEQYMATYGGEVHAHEFGLQNMRLENAYVKAVQDGETPPLVLAKICDSKTKLFEARAKHAPKQTVPTQEFVPADVASALAEFEKEGQTS